MEPKPFIDLGGDVITEKIKNMYYRVAINNEVDTNNFHHLLQNLNYVTNIEEEYVLSEILTKKNKYKLKIPLYSKVYKKEGMIYIKKNITNTIGVGKNIDKALKDFADEFNFAYENYTSKDDKDLTKDALILKYFFLTIVENESIK